MRTLLFLMMSLAAYGQSTLSNPVWILSPSGGGATPVRPVIDLGARLGSLTHRFEEASIGEVNTDTINALTTVLKLNGAPSTNGNILLQPGNVAGNASVYAIAARLDQPGLIIQDASGTTTGNSLELRTAGGVVYAKMIGGTDPGAPGQFGTNGFFCITSGTCNLGFTTNRFVHVYGKELNAVTASGPGLSVTSSDAFATAATIDNTGGGSGLAVGANCAACIAFSMTNANAAGVQLQFGPGGAGGIFSVNYYVNNGAPAGGCNNGDMYHRKDGGVGTTFYGCRSGAWTAWF